MMFPVSVKRWKISKKGALDRRTLVGIARFRS